MPKGYIIPFLEKPRIGSYSFVRKDIFILGAIKVRILTDLILDETDLRILNLLARNSRSSYSKIGKSIGLTTKSAKSRIDKMLKEKVIDRFVTLVSPNILDYSIICIFIIKKDKLNHDVFEKVTLVGDIIYRFSVLGGVEGLFIGIRVSSEDKFMLLLISLKSIVIGIMIQKCVAYKLNFRLTVMDCIIIKHLLQNPKIKTSEIGNKTTLSTKSIHRRLQKMQNNRLIQSTILPSPAVIKGQIVFLWRSKLIVEVTKPYLNLFLVKFINT